MFRLCIVDDFPLLREALAASFEGAGFSVSTAEDAASALSCVEAVAPHIVLTDLQQPGVEDASIVAILRAAFPALPIVAMSGNPHLEAKARELGAVDFVGKPFCVTQLAARLRQHIQGIVSAAA